MHYYDVYVRRFGDLYKASYVPRFVRDDGLPFIKKDYVNKKVGDKFLNNIIRARSKILEYAMCNDFDFFFTGTLDSSKYCRDDLETFYTDFSRFIRNIRGYYNCDIKYLFVPELHKDGKSWHIHGLISGIPENQLFCFSPEIHPLHLVKKNYLYWDKYLSKFGFCSLAPIKSKTAVSRYITKYITEELGDSIPKGSHMYYCSRGLETSSLVFQGCVTDLPEGCYKGEFCSTLWSEDLNAFLDVF